MMLFDFVRDVWESVTRRNIVLPREFTPHTDAAEVYDERQKMSASAYVAHLKEAMAGTADPKERLAWSKYIVGLQLREPDAYNAFFFDVDALIDQGELVYVPTPEERAEIQRRILDNIDHWRDESSDIAKDYGINPAAMHKLMSVTHSSGEDAFTPNPLPQVTEEDLLAIDEDEADAWLEDIEDE